MHEHYDRHLQGHAEADEKEALSRIKTMLEHWIEHEDGHKEGYREWGAKASQAGEEEIAREIYLAIQESDKVRAHLKRARDIAAAKLVLRK